MSYWNKEELEQMLEDVVNELDLYDAAIEKHGPHGTPPAELVRLVLQEKDCTIRNLRAGLQDCASCREKRVDNVLLKRLARWIAKNPPQHGDHACRECYPNGNLLQDGFVCAYHEAVKILEHCKRKGEGEAMTDNKREKWTERIRCPECEKEQDATVEFKQGWPFPAYIHNCEACGYIIVESEWERVEAVET